MLSLYQKYGRLGSLPTCRKLRLHCDCWLWVYFLSLLRDRECCCSVSKSCLTLCNPLDYSTSGFPVHHHLLEFAQTHVYWVGDTILTVSSSAAPFSFCLQSFPASGSFPMSQLFPSGGQSIEASASASVLPLSIQGWFPLGLTGLISVLSKRLSGIFSTSTIWKHQFGAQPSLWSNSHIHTCRLKKAIALTIWTFVSKVMSLLFNTLSRFVNSFSFKEQASFNFTAAITICSDFGAQENKICHCFHFFKTPSICREVRDQNHSTSDSSALLVRAYTWITVILNRFKGLYLIDRGSWHCTEGGDQDHPQEKEIKKGKMVVWGGLTNTWENKRSKRERRKGKIYPFEWRVPKNSKER